VITDAGSSGNRTRPDTAHEMVLICKTHQQGEESTRFLRVDDLLIGGDIVHVVGHHVIDCVLWRRVELD